MSESIERVENLIRVVSAVPDENFDIRCWYDPQKNCGCAIGYAVRDRYFIAHEFNPIPPHSHAKSTMQNIAEFFDISVNRVHSLFINQVNYGSRREVLAALRVLLLEKMAQKIGDEIKPLSTPGDGSEWGGMFVSDQMEMA